MKTEDEHIELTEEEEIELMSACGMTNSEMAIALGYNKAEFVEKALDPTSIVYHSILKGKLVSEVKIAGALKRLAEMGNITAVQQFDKHLEKKGLAQIKKKIWFG
ncbi:hypothetical protein [Altibacter sp. HG106]|uniref:hypothetical protein n=1 Tax=Altibacter sp. HG106 TaxID=3023937 RepID=UPI0023506FF9|nr:hypothetical protein [Altibacter sp. HG106]MDC7994459.1 hypothetical protein [Altibacter sp. HG106]